MLVEYLPYHHEESLEGGTQLIQQRVAHICSVQVGIQPLEVVQTPPPSPRLTGPSGNDGVQVGPRVDGSSGTFWRICDGGLDLTRTVDGILRGFYQ